MCLRGSSHLLKLHTECWLGAWALFPGKRVTLKPPGLVQLLFYRGNEAREGKDWWTLVRRRLSGPPTYKPKSPRVPHKDSVWEG